MNLGPNLVVGPKFVTMGSNRTRTTERVIKGLSAVVVMVVILYKESWALKRTPCEACCAAARFLNPKPLTSKSDIQS